MADLNIKPYGEGWSGLETKSPFTEEQLEAMRMGMMRYIGLDPKTPVVTYDNRTYKLCPHCGHEIE